MDDLIRRSDVLETYADLYDIFDDNKAIQEELHKVFDKINSIPAVEPKQGEWKITNTYKGHSGRVVDRVEHTDCGYIWNREMGEPLHNFCPNCGARMFAKDINVPNKEGIDDEHDK